MNRRGEALSEASRSPRHLRLAWLGAGLLLVGLACQRRPPVSGQAQDGDDVRRELSGPVVPTSCPGELPDGGCVEFRPRKPRTCEVEVRGEPGKWDVSPELTCVNRGDKLVFVRPDGGVLPTVSFRAENPRDLFQDVDGGSFVPPGRGAREWEAVVKPDAAPGRYGFTVFSPKDGSAAGGGPGMGLTLDGGGEFAGESGDLEVVRDTGFPTED